MAIKRQKFPPKTPKEGLLLLANWASSLALAAGLLIYLTILTLLGTLNQMEDGLYDSVSKYFSSFFFADSFFGWWIALPGGLLALTILFFNMLAGTIFRIRVARKNFLLYGVHFGILFLLFAGFVEMVNKTEGHMTLYEGMQSNEYVSHHNWQLEIIPIEEDGTAGEALVIPYDRFHRATPDDPRTFWADQLPFEIVVDRYVRNGFVLPDSIPITAEHADDAIDGWVLLKTPSQQEAEQNMPGIHVRFVPKEGSEGEEVESILYAHYAAPLGNSFYESVPKTLEFGGKKWAAQLVRERFKVPFFVRLDDFTVEHHPGTQSARNYQSNVTKIEEGHSDQGVEIKMNEPLRDDGVVFFQSSYGPPNRALQPGEKYYSTFTVVDNPSDQWPKWACIFIGVALSSHFLLRLVMFFIRTGKSAANAVKASASATS